MQNNEDIFRRLLWLNHGHTGMYGDDGEMQCGRCMEEYGFWDWKRTPAEEIEKRITIAGIRKVQLHDRNAQIADAARWYVECSRLYETLIEYHIKPPFNPNGFDEILNIYLQARADLKAAVEGE